MADTDEKILQVLEALQADVKDVKQGQTRLEDGQAHLKTVVETLQAGKTDIQDLKATVMKKVNDHEQRITDLEKETGIPHPH